MKKNRILASIVMGRNDWQSMVGNANRKAVRSELYRRLCAVARRVGKFVARYGKGPWTSKRNMILLAMEWELVDVCSEMQE